MPLIFELIVSFFVVSDTTTAADVAVTKAPGLSTLFSVFAFSLYSNFFELA